MVRRFSALLVPVIAAIGFFVPSAAHAEHCGGDVVEVGAGYVDNRGTSGGVWLYLESNGVEGLQQGGKSITLDEADPCQHTNPDTLVL